MVDYDEWCRKCQNYKFDINEGILCGLTNATPAFEGRCPDFKLDREKAERVHHGQVRERKAGTRIKTSGVSMIIGGTLWLLVAAVLSGGLPIAPLILTIVGVVTYMRGRKIEQEN